MGSIDLEDELGPKTLNQLLSALSHEDARGALTYFRETSENVASLNVLAEYIANSQNGCDTSSAERIAIYLHHAGLPKLAEAGVLDYDPRSKTVRCWDHPLLEVESLSEVVEVTCDKHA